MQLLKRIPIHPTFYIFAAYFVVVGEFLPFLNLMIVLFFHEMGHYFVSKRLGYSLERFYIAPYGACLDFKEKQFERNDEIKIAIAGPVVNFVLAFATLSLWWVFPQIYGASKSFFEQNLFLGAFNLLPAFPLDGGRVLLALLSNKWGRNKAFKMVKIFNLVFSGLFFLLFIFCCFYSFNPTFAIVSALLLSGFFQGNFVSKYKNSFLFEKRISNFSKSKRLLVKEGLSFIDLLKKIDRDTYTIFDIISEKGELVSLTEKQVIDICVKFGGESKLSRLFD